MLVLCSICHEFYDGVIRFAFCPHNKMNRTVIPTDYCKIHKLVPSQYSGEICPLCTVRKRKETVGKTVRFTSGFYEGEHGIILQYRGHSKLAGHSFEVMLIHGKRAITDGIRIITTERHFKMDRANERRKVRNNVSI